MFELVLPVVTWVSWTSSRNGYVRLLGALAASFEHLAHCRSVVRLNIFYSRNFGRSSSELVELVPLPYFHGKPTCYFDSLMILLSPSLEYYKHVYDNSFFLAQLDFVTLCQQHGSP